MTYYLGLIDEANGDFGAIVPDCPGCTAMGNSFEEVLHNAADALRQWMADRQLEGFEAPHARSIKDLRSDPTLSVDFEAGAVVANIPLLLDTGRSVRANILLDSGLLSAIDEAAKVRGLTRSSFLASAARDKIAAGR